MLQSLMVDDVATANAPRYETQTLIIERLYEPFDPDEAREYRRSVAETRMRASIPDTVEDAALPTIVVDGVGPIDDPYAELDVDP